MDLDVRMRRGHRRDSLRRRDQVHELDPDRLDRAPALEDIDRSRRRAARGEHRVEDQAQVDRRGIGQLVVVLDWLQRPLVAEQPEMPDLGGRHQVEHRVDHPEAGPQDRHERELLPRDPGAPHRLEWRLDVHGLERQILRHFVRHQHRDLVHELLEVARAGLLVAQDRELVLDQGVGQDRQVGEMRWGDSRHERRRYAMGAAFAAPRFSDCNYLLLGVTSTWICRGRASAIFGSVTVRTPCS